MDAIREFFQQPPQSSGGVISSLGRSRTPIARPGPAVAGRGRFKNTELARAGMFTQASLFAFGISYSSGGMTRAQPAVLSSIRGYERTVVYAGGKMNSPLAARGLSESAAFDKPRPFTNISILRGISYVASREVSNEFVPLQAHGGSYVVTRETTRPLEGARTAGRAFAAGREYVHPGAVAISRGSAFVTTRETTAPLVGVVGAGLSESADRVYGKISTRAFVTGLSESDAYEKANESAVAVSRGSSREYVSAGGITRVAAQTHGTSETTTRAAAVDSVIVSARGVDFSESFERLGPGRSTVQLRGLSESTSRAIAQPTSRASMSGLIRTSSRSLGNERALAAARGRAGSVATREYLSQGHVVSGFFDIDFELEIEPVVAFGSFDLEPLVQFEMDVSPQIQFNLDLEQP